MDDKLHELTQQLEGRSGMFPRGRLVVGNDIALDNNCYSFPQQCCWRTFENDIQMTGFGLLLERHGEESQEYHASVRCVKGSSLKA